MDGNLNECERGGFGSLEVDRDKKEISILDSLHTVLEYLPFFSSGGPRRISIGALLAPSIG